MDAAVNHIPSNIPLNILSESSANILRHYGYQIQVPPHFSDPLTMKAKFHLSPFDQCQLLPVEANVTN